MNRAARQSVGGTTGSGDDRTTSAPPRQSVTDFLAKAIVLGTPVAYAIGRIYSEGYWTELGIAPVAMARGTEDYLYLAFVMVVNGLALALPTLSDPGFWGGLFALVVVLAGLGLLLWMVNAVGDWLRPRIRRARRSLRTWAKKRRSLSAAVRLAGTTTVAGLSILYVFAFCASCLLLPLLIAHQLGEASARRMKERLATQPDRFALVEVGGVRGRLVDCTERRCVIQFGGAFLPVEAEGLQWVRGATPSANASASRQHRPEK